MLNRLKNLSAAAAILLAFAAVPAQAQISTPAPSPAATVKQRVGLTDITVDYSRPSMRGRKVFGEVVPYNKIWRTGANAPTKLTFSDSVTIGGTALAAGEYALYTIPGENEWTIIIGKDARVQAGSFTDAHQAARFKVTPERVTPAVETFTIDFSDLTTNTANLTLTWENTRVKIPVETEVDRRVMASIQSAMNNTGHYYQAANYYLNTNRDMKQALEWIDKDIAVNPTFWKLHTKAKIQSRMGDCKGAEATARRSITMAREAKNEEYVKMNETLIAECKPGQGQAQPAKEPKPGR